MSPPSVRECRKVSRYSTIAETKQAIFLTYIFFIHIYNKFLYTIYSSFAKEQNQRERERESEL